MQIRLFEMSKCSTQLIDILFGLSFSFNKQSLVIRRLYGSADFDLCAMNT